MSYANAFSPRTMTCFRKTRVGRCQPKLKEPAATSGISHCQDAFESRTPGPFGPPAESLSDLSAVKPSFAFCLKKARIPALVTSCAKTAHALARIQLLGPVKAARPSLHLPSFFARLQLLPKVQCSMPLSAGSCRSISDRRRSRRKESWLSCQL